MRVIIFLSVFFIFHKCGILDAIPARTSKVSTRLDSKPISNNICVSPACKEAASQILKDMDPKVSPCDNFYKFACGNFLKTTVIPEGETYVDKFSLASKELEQRLKSVIEEEIGPDEPKAFRLAKNFYKTCMNTAQIEKQGLRTVLAELKAVGGWPVVEGKSWEPEAFDWVQAVSKLRKSGYATDYFFSYGIGVNLEDNTKRAIYIDQTPLGLVREYLIQGFNHPVVKAYYRYLVDIAVMYGANRALAERELKETLEFEIKLAKISIPATQEGDPTQNATQITIKELSQKYPTINWITLFNAILSPILQVDESELVIVNTPVFFDKFEKLIEVTPKRVQVNYFLRRAIDENMNYLTDEIRSRKIEFLREVSDGKAEAAPRWSECFDMTIQSLGLSVNALYIRKYFDQASKQRAVEMVNNIATQLKKRLSEADWMDGNTKKLALEKAEGLKSYVAYPDEFFDDKKLEEYFTGLEITPTNYLQVAANVSIYKQEYSFRQLRKPVRDYDWSNTSDSAVIDAAYHLEENSMELPAGILQGHFFGEDKPQYLNYAAIGSIIAHEITYGFGEEGSQFDKDGNSVNWWSQETIKKYLTKADCFIKQYGNYTAEEVRLQLNGYNTLIENIAYNGGIKESYLAYQEWVRQNGLEPKLPGLKYTPAQLFWIDAAQTWCTDHTPEELKDIITNDIHSPAEFRILGAFSNRPEFSSDFNCPVGSKMNPAHKCSVW